MTFVTNSVYRVVSLFEVLFFWFIQLTVWSVIELILTHFCCSTNTDSWINISFSFVFVF